MPLFEYGSEQVCPQQKLDTSKNGDSQILCGNGLKSGQKKCVEQAVNSPSQNLTCPIRFAVVFDLGHIVLIWASGGRLFCERGMHQWSQSNPLGRPT